MNFKLNFSFIYIYIYIFFSQIIFLKNKYTKNMILAEFRKFFDNTDECINFIIN